MITMLHTERPGIILKFAKHLDHIPRVTIITEKDRKITEVNIKRINGRSGLTKTIDRICECQPIKVFLHILRDL